MRWVFVLLSVVLTQTMEAQELFIRTEPASNLPKGVLGIRGIAEYYQEGAITRSMYALRALYGVNPRLTVWLQANISNHHDNQLPDDLIDDEGGIQHTHDIVTTEPYPMIFNGFHAYAKYLFLKHDQQNRHFRMAAYGEASSSLTAHDEAEPNFMDDNAGLGAGIVATQLVDRFAASLTVGAAFPLRYVEKDRDITLYYGRAVSYSLSLGYLLLPVAYKDYTQTNLNLYLEFIGRANERAEIYLEEERVFIGQDTPALRAGNYVEIHPGIQLILNSTTRIDMGMGFRMWNTSYRHPYPLYFFQVQHYFF
ncbi:MAG: hypothetical protein AAF587_29075 [Bacteroidota bacterium]